MGRSVGASFDSATAQKEFNCCDALWACLLGDSPEPYEDAKTRVSRRRSRSVKRTKGGRAASVGPGKRAASVGRRSKSSKRRDQMEIDHRGRSYIRSKSAGDMVSVKSTRGRSRSRPLSERSRSTKSKKPTRSRDVENLDIP